RDKLVTGVQTCALPIFFEHAAFHFEIVDAAGERIGEGLEHENGSRLGVVVFALDAVALASRVLVADLGVLVRMRKRVGEKRKQRSEERRVGKGCRAWGA